MKGTSLGPGIGGSKNIKFSNTPKLAEALAIFRQRRRKQESRGGSKEKLGMDSSIPEGFGTTSLGARHAVSLRKFFLKPPQTGGCPGDFFVDQDKNSYQDVSNKKKLGRDESVSEGVKGTSLGPGRGGSRKKKFSKIPQTGGSPGDFFSRQEDTSLSSPNSGKSPGKT